jgi:hypothetical protein
MTPRRCSALLLAAAFLLGYRTWPVGVPVLSTRRSFQEVLSMKARLTGMVSAVFCLWAVAAATGGEPDVRPVKKTVRADDGLKLVCEVRGQGDAALVFLHGWCGDRAYWKHQADAFAADYLELFQVEIDGGVFGLVEVSEPDAGLEFADRVAMVPGNLLFHAPWDGSYDT